MGAGGGCGTGGGRDWQQLGVHCGAQLAEHARPHGDGILGGSWGGGGGGSG